MRLMVTNYCTEPATTVTASTEDTNFPASNLKHPFRSKRWRSTDVTSESVVYDFVTTEAINSVVLLWPREDGIKLSASAVIKIQANATNSWSSPSVDQTLTISNDYSIASHYFNSDQSYRYWRVKIEDPSNTLGFVELGLAWIGKALAIENAQNGFVWDLIDQSNSTKTEFGHVYDDEYPILQSIEFKYQFIDYDTIQILENAYRLNGSTNPVLVVIDQDEDVFDKDHFMVYGKFKPKFGLAHVRYNIFNTDGISVMELA